MKSCMLGFIALFILPASIFADTAPAYAIVLSNGVKLKVSEYQINMELDTITYRSDASGLTATFPLERVKHVVQYDAALADVPDAAPVLFRNESSIQDFPDDGGIPVTFKVKATAVGSSDSGYGGTQSSNRGFSQTKGSSSGSNASSGGSSTSSNRFGQSTSRTSKPATSTTSSSSSSSSSSSQNSSNSSFDAFMNALTGGKK